MRKEPIKLSAYLDGDYLVLSLSRGKNFIGEGKLANNKDLSRKTLPFLEKLLGKNKLSVEEIKKTEFESELPDSSTSRRIVQTMLNVISHNI